MALYKQALSRLRNWRREQQFRDETVLNELAAAHLIAERIRSGAPLMVSRFSTCEINVLNVHRQRQRPAYLRDLYRLLTNVPGDYTDKIRFQAQNNAGIFPTTNEGLDRFAEITFDACTRIDILGIWPRSLPLEEQLYKERCPAARLIPFDAISPYAQPEPWSVALAGKTVLVVHPYEESIRRQYEKRELLFPGRDVLPEFELQTVRVVQSNAGNSVNFSSWADALESMEEQIKIAEFDIALIGAGAYGLPLAACVKDLGKQAVHMGGTLQLLFGIKGARWDSRPEGVLYNEHWARPLSSETPEQSGRVEDGCYW